MKKLLSFSAPAGRLEFFGVSILAIAVNYGLTAVLTDEPNATSLIQTLTVWGYLAMMFLGDSLYLAIVSAVAFRRTADLSWPSWVPGYYTLVLVTGTAISWFMAFNGASDAEQKLLANGIKALTLVPHLCFLFKPGQLWRDAAAAKRSIQATA